MKAKITIAVRVLMGLLFLFGGVVGLFELFPAPPDLPERLQTFNAGLAASGYFMKLLKITEIVCALFLISGRFVPLALVILAPISINIFMVHAFIAPDGLPVASLIGAAMIYLSFFAEPYASRLKPLFKK